LGDNSGAWSELRILGIVALDGGQLGNYDPAPAFPSDAQAALRALEDRLNDFDRLRSDEAQITAWRDQNAANRSNQRAPHAERLGSDA
jgi:hypothetical protein